MKYLKILAFLPLLAIPFLSYSVADNDYGRIAQVVADGLPKTHLNHEAFDDAISEKALRNLLDSLDYDHSIFLMTDVDGFKDKVPTLDDALKEGHTEFAFEVFDLFKKRTKERIDYLDTIFKNGFDMEKDETHIWKRKDEPWPENEKEQNDLWRRKMKHEMVSRLVSTKMKAEEAERKAKEEAEKKQEDKNPENPKKKDLDEKVDLKSEKIEEVTPEAKILKKYEQFLTVLEAHDEEWILQLYLNSFVRAYDTHSSFLAPRANEDFDIAMKLSLTGIGALLSLEDGAAKIVRLIPGGPAEQSGLLETGDKIIAVAQGDEQPVDIMYWPLYKSVRLIRGEIGTTVVLSVIPASDAAETTVNKVALVRKTIKLEEREAKYAIRDVEAKGGKKLKIGVLTLPEFYADMRGRKNGASDVKSCATDVRKLLDKMNAEGVDGILMDLRNNGGGSLPDCIEMTGYFIDTGPVVQVKSRGSRPRILPDPNKDSVYDGPLVVLVNRQSASASEILAAALQDYGRAIIVGDSKTHGKGSVQTLFPLVRRSPEMGSLKITTAGFYRIDGSSTQLKGVTPDIIIPSAMDKMEIGEEYLQNVLSLTSVDPAVYDQNANMNNLVPRLKKRSEQRREKNEKFQVHAKILERLEENVSQIEISLNYNKRLERARKNRALDDLQAELFKDEDEDQTEDPKEDDPAEVDPNEDKMEAKKKNDIILDESLFILRDLIEESGGTKVLSSK